MNNGWDEYQKLVLAELKRLSDGQKDLTDGLQALRVEFEALKTGQMIRWSIVAAATSAAIALAGRLL